MKMFAVKKNQVIITALVAMIAAAGYLNYIDSAPQKANEVMLTDNSDIALVGDSNNVAVTDDNPEIAAAESTTSGSTSSEKNEEKTTNVNKAEADSDAGAAVFVNSSTDTSYFVQAKLDREQSRAKQKDMLNEMLNNEKATSEQKNEATTAMLQIQKRIEKENAAEDMLKAKGFSEVYVRIDDDTVDVVVDKEKLTDTEIAQIEDTIKRKTGLPADKIRITPFKKSSK
jgi:stage III sporulation protein AH